MRQLTPTKWGLLVAAATAPERIFSRYELVNRVRGFEYAGYERTIDAHDQSLRLGRVVSDLAELPAAESGGRADPRADVDLCQVARDEIVARDSQLRAAGLVVDSLLDGPLWVRADADRLHGIGLAVVREIITPTAAPSLWSRPRARGRPSPSSCP